MYYLQARFELVELFPFQVVTAIESQLATQISEIHEENRALNNHEVVGGAIGKLADLPQYQDFPPEVFGKVYSLGLSRIDLKNHRSENTMIIEI